MESVERLEDVRVVLGRDADAAVKKIARRLSSFCANVDSRRLGGPVANGVSDQVLKELDKARLGHAHIRQTIMGDRCAIV